MRLKFRGEASRLLLAAVVLGAAPAAAQDYPASTETAVLSAWLGKSTNIAPTAVVSVTPELVVAIAGKAMPATAGGPVRLTLREEVIAPAYVDTVGGRSSLMSMEIHCDERRVRMDERRLYSGLNLTGAVEISDPSAEWVRIPEGSIMDEVARATCDAEYPWPLRTAAAPSAPDMAVAALNTPAPVLPPGPDARVVADEPPPAENKTAAIETAPVPEPEVVPAPETATEPMAQVEPPAPPPPEQVVAEAAPEPAPEISSEPSSPVEPPPPSPSEPTEIAATPEAEAAPAAAEPAPAEPNPAETPPAPPAEPEPEIAAPPPAGPVFAVQIGAYETREMAEAAWAALSANRPVLVDGLSFEIRPVRVRGKDWQRGLVRGFASRRDAGAFCTAIAGTEYGCILRPLAE